MVERIVAGMFGLILVFLLLSRSSEFNSIINSFGGFVQSQSLILQGRNPGASFLGSGSIAR